MKKVALVLALSFFLPLVGMTVSHATSSDSDLAIGDPQGGTYHRKTRKHSAKPAATSTDAAAKEAPKATEKAPAEKAAEPTK